MQQVGRWYLPVVAALAASALGGCSSLDRTSRGLSSLLYPSGNLEQGAAGTSSHGSELVAMGGAFGQQGEHHLAASKLDVASATPEAAIGTQSKLLAVHGDEMTSGDEAGLDEAAPPEAMLDEPDDGFCWDDVYAQHLIQEHRVREAAKKGPSGKLAVFDPQRHRAAVFHAKRRLIGATNPYFGSIPIVANDRIEVWMHYFKTHGRAEFLKWLVRGESLRRIVQPILQDSGVPTELFYLAMVESGFSNQAFSRKRATGTWQFMPGTAKNYGLRIDSWVDERRDPIKSTLAAASYLRELYVRLGDWHLAMAAYNAGPSKIRRAMAKAGTRNFWRLSHTPHLARETKNYVPKVLAAVLLASDARGHGFEIKAQESDLFPDTEVLVHQPVRLSELAQALDVPDKTLQSWNPEILRGMTPPALKGYPLRLPHHLASRYLSVEPKLNKFHVVDMRMHLVRKGDTLERIAKDYKVSIHQLRSLNPALSPSRLKVGSAVAIPVTKIVTAPKRRDAV